jgi:putative flippase GtrA
LGASKHLQKEIATNTQSEGFADAARQLAYRLHLPTTLVKFLIVGGIGFLINQLFLFVFYDTPLAWFLPAKHAEADLGLYTNTDMRLLYSSVLAVEIAIVAQFNFHERWTFRKRKQGGAILTRFAKYNLSSIVSPIIVVATINALTPVLRDAAGTDSLVGTAAPYLSNTLGVLLGFTWNWTLNSLIIWPRLRDETLEAE